MMKHTLNALVSLTFVAVALSASTGCSKGSSCDKLADKICEGKDAATCAKAKSALEETLSSGPSGSKLSDSDKAMACSMIRDDKAALDSYVTEMSKRASK